MTLKGDAGFKYNTGGGVVTHTLQFPLYNIRPGGTTTRYTGWSLDNKTHEVVTITSSAVREIVATVRFDSDPWDLLDALEAGANGFELEYYPSLAVTGTKYDCQLVEPSGKTIDLLRDRSGRGRLGETEIDIRLRRIDGGTFEALFP